MSWCQMDIDVLERIAVRKVYRTTCWTVRRVANSGWAKCRVSGDMTGGVETYRSCCALHGRIPIFTNKQLALLRVGQNPVRTSTRSPAALIENFRDFPHLLQADSQEVPQTRPQLLPFTYFLVYYSLCVLPLDAT